ncbi:Ig-like domain-containing protein [Paenibacillus tuaregi]|uniref:Ig-like domain-containing protein n=1 Tax=Paenibacillus tuaregi TaxID=1816681 RepID=UPI000837E2A4|nr:Ig-like domain-containing protein [Paenibacillus tuaregi]
MFQSIIRKTSYAVASLAILSGIVINPGYASPVSASASAHKPVIEWSHQYGKDQLNSNGRSVTATEDGGYIVTGDIEEDPGSGYGITKAYVLKLDASGKVQWDQKIQHGDSEYTYAHQAAPTQDGGYIVSGATKNYDGRPHNVVFLAKLNAQGNVEWENEYGDGYTNQYGESVVQAEDGGFVVTGYSVTSYGEAPAYVLKTDAQGKKLWYKKFRFGSNQYFNDVIATPDGGTIAVGTLNSVIGTGEDDAGIATKLNANGEEVWTHKYAQPNSGRSAYAIIPSDDDGYLIASRTKDDVNLLTKTDASGEVIWEKSSTSPDGRELFTELARTKNGYALIGQNEKGSYPDEQNRFEILLLDQSGEIADRLIFGDANLYGIGKGTYAPDGGFVVTGQAHENNKYFLQLTKLAAPDQPQVDPVLTGIKFTDSSKKISVGEHAPTVVNAVYSDGSATGLTDEVTFSSDDEHIAVVDGKGQITGIKPGSATITAVYQGLQAQLKVEVSETPGNGNPDGEGTFYLDSDEYSLTAGTSLDTIAFFKDKDGKIHDVTKDAAFKSDNPKVVEYDEDGNIIGVHAGITHITAEYKGHSYRALVQVVRASVPK